MVSGIRANCEKNWKKYLQTYLVNIKLVPVFCIQVTIWGFQLEIRIHIIRNTFNTEFIIFKKYTSRHCKFWTKLKKMKNRFFFCFYFELTRCIDRNYLTKKFTQPLIHIRKIFEISFFRDSPAQAAFQDKWE